MFYVGIISFALGISLRSLFIFNNYFVLFTVLLAGAFFVYGIFLQKFSKGDFFKAVLICSFMLTWAVAGIVRSHISQSKAGDPILNSFIGESVTLVGMVNDEPDERENSVRLTVDFESAEVGDLSYAVQSRGVVIVDFYPKYNYGDRLEISGKLQRPENFTNDLGREFDYINFLAKDGIYYQIFRPKIALMEEGQGNFVIENIFAFKNAFLERIKEAVPEPESSLASGLLLGTKQSLGAKTLDDFRIAGLIHIVVLSGYNITIVAEFLMSFFSYFLRKRIASIFGIVSIVLFVIMTGAGATIVRAGIMAILVIVARISGRNFDALRALFIAGLVMLIHNPKILLFDPSFQLSFMATLGLISVSPIISKYLHFLTDRFGLKELTASTVSTQIFVLPLLLYMMGQLSIVGLPVNLLVLVFIPYAMLFSFTTGFLGFIFSPLAIPFGFLGYLILAYIFKVVEIFASLPFASISVSYFPLWLMILIYAIYGFVIWKINKR